MEIKTIVRSTRRRGAAKAEPEAYQAPTTLLTSAGDPASTDDDSLLRITAEDVQDSLKETVQISIGVGVPVPDERATDKSGRTQAEVLLLEVDLKAEAISAELAVGLRRNPDVQARSGEAPDALLQRRQQSEAVTLLDKEAGHLDEAVDGGRRVIAATLRAVGPKVEAAMEYLLKLPNLLPEKREQLLSAKAQLQALDAKAKAQREEQAQKTRSATAAGAQAVAAAQRHLHMAEAMVDLQKGSDPADLDPSALENAIAGMNDEDEDDRRGQGR